MKASETFKTVIENYLKETALNDSAFASAFSKTSKNIEDCIKYIISEVKKTGLCAFADNEIFEIAVKYYFNDSITKPVQTNCKVIVNQSVEANSFSNPIENEHIVAEKTLVKETSKTLQTTLNLFES